MTFKEWYSEENLTKLEAWARDGLTEADICKNIGIATVTLWDWKNKYPNVSNALKKGKEVADIIIENALYRKATGYNAKVKKAFKVREILYDAGKKIKEAEKIVYAEEEVHIPPDTIAQIFWLKNRKPDVWKDKRDVDIGANESIEAINIKVDTINEKDVDRLKALQENLFKDGT